MEKTTQNRSTQSSEPLDIRSKGSLEVRIHAAGEDLLNGFVRVLSQIPGGDSGPQQLAKELGVDKVLASRILKAMRAPDPMSVIHRVPGPEPMRRLL